MSPRRAPLGGHVKEPMPIPAILQVHAMYLWLWYLIGTGTHVLQLITYIFDHFGNGLTGKKYGLPRNLLFAMSVCNGIRQFSLQCVSPYLELNDWPSLGVYVCTINAWLDCQMRNLVVSEHGFPRRGIDMHWFVLWTPPALSRSPESEWHDPQIKAQVNLISIRMYHPFQRLHRNLLSRTLLWFYIWMNLPNSEFCLFRKWIRSIVSGHSSSVKISIALCTKSSVVTPLRMPNSARDTVSSAFSDFTVMDSRSVSDRTSSRTLR